MIGPDYQRPLVTAPGAFRAVAAATAHDAQSVAELKWFEVFKDEELQELIRTALVQNYDLRDAVAASDRDRLAPVVDDDEAHRPPVVRVDRPGGVQDGDARAGGEAVRGLRMRREGKISSSWLKEPTAARTRQNVAGFPFG